MKNIDVLNFDNSFVIDSSNTIINNFISEYNRDEVPIDVNFRKLVEWLPQNGRATHFIHPYTAKLLMHIPNLFLSNDILTKKNNIILDPFCGSGTVPLEANLNGRKAIGIDVNPLATLIARVKTTNYSIEHLMECKKKINNQKAHLNSENPDVINLGYWYSKVVIDELNKLWHNINTVEDELTKDFFKVCFSLTTRKFSYADPCVSVPVKINLNKDNEAYLKKAKLHMNFLKVTDVADFYNETVLQNIEMFKEIETFRFESKIVNGDIKMDLLDSSEQVDMIITSPPYAGAQKYVRASSLNLGWLGLVPSKLLSQLEKLNIGREHYLSSDYKEFKETGVFEADNLLRSIYQEYPLRAHIASNYICEMRLAFSNASRYLKKDGFLVLVAGNNVVCGKDFNTQLYLERILHDLGFKTLFKLCDTIKSRGLMTKRNKTASLITREWVILLQKQ